MPTLRARILENLQARVAAICIANGFETNAGELVFTGDAFGLGEDDPDQAVAIAFGDEQPRWQNEGLACVIRLPINVMALSKAEIDAPWMAIEALVGDIKRAVEIEDRTLGGLLRFPIERGAVVTMERAPGSKTVGAAVSYAVTYKEGWGHP